MFGLLQESAIPGAIPWAIAIPVVGALVGAVVALWRNQGVKDEEIKRLNEWRVKKLEKDLGFYEDLERNQR